MSQAGQERERDAVLFAPVSLITMFDALCNASVCMEPARAPHPSVWVGGYQKKKRDGHRHTHTQKVCLLDYKKRGSRASLIELGGDISRTTRALWGVMKFLCVRFTPADPIADDESEFKGVCSTASTGIVFLFISFALFFLLAGLLVGVFDKHHFGTIHAARRPSDTTTSNTFSYANWWWRRGVGC